MPLRRWWRTARAESTRCVWHLLPRPAAAVTTRSVGAWQHGARGHTHGMRTTGETRRRSVRGTVFGVSFRVWGQSGRGSPSAMSYLVHIGQAPLGVVKALGSRVWFALPGLAGTLASYSCFPQPTLPGESQNLAGDGLDTCLLHVHCRVRSHTACAWSTDFVVVAQSVSLCAISAALLFYTGIWHDLSVSLDMTPWREGQDALLAEALVSGTALEEVPLRCPFYKGELPETQCRACGTVVSRSGVHEVCACVWGVRVAWPALLFAIRRPCWFDSGAACALAGDCELVGQPGPGLESGHACARDMLMQATPRWSDRLLRASVVHRSGCEAHRRHRARPHRPEQRAGFCGQPGLVPSLALLPRCVGS